MFSIQKILGACFLFTFILSNLYSSSKSMKTLWVEKWEKRPKYHELQPGDTAENSSEVALFAFLGRHRATLLPGSEIKFNSPKKQKKEGVISLEKGKLYFDNFGGKKKATHTLASGGLVIEISKGSLSLEKSGNKVIAILSSGKAKLSGKAKAQSLEQPSRITFEGDVKIEPLKAEELKKELALASPQQAFPVEVTFEDVLAEGMKKPPIAIFPRERKGDDNLYHLSKFEMSTTEIPNSALDQYEKWLDLTGVKYFQHPLMPEEQPLKRNKSVEPHFNSLFKEKRPAVFVSWWQAFSFCRWMGGRLPTELEWTAAGYWKKKEWLRLPWGDKGLKDGKIGKYSNFADGEFIAWVMGKGIKWPDLDASVREKDGHKLTVEVGTMKKGKSPYGLTEMAGNVSEWVDAKGMSRTMDGKSSRISKGGNWGTIPDHMQISSPRFERDPNQGFPTVGIRVLRNIFTKK